MDEETTNRLNELGENLNERIEQAVNEVLNRDNSPVPSDSPTANGHKTPVEHKGTASCKRRTYITGIGSILVVHLPSVDLQSLYYHLHALRRPILSRARLHCPQYRARCARD